MEKMRQNLYIPREIKEKVDKIAADEHRSFSAQVVSMIVDGIKARKNDG